jgi:hypothetical protein
MLAITLTRIQHRRQFHIHDMGKVTQGRTGDGTQEMVLDQVILGMKEKLGAGVFFDDIDNI